MRTTLLGPTFKVCDAAKRGDLGELTRLLDGGGSANERRAGALEATGCTALHEACAARSGAAVALLLSRGADPNAQTLKGVLWGLKAPLHVAIESGAEDCVRALLAAPAADPNAACQNGWRAVHYAAQGKQPAVLAALLACPAVAAAAALRDGRTALDVALEGDAAQAEALAACLLRAGVPPFPAARRALGDGRAHAIALLGRLNCLDAPQCLELLEQCLAMQAAALRETDEHVAERERARSGGGGGGGDPESRFNAFLQRLVDLRKREAQSHACAAALVGAARRRLAAAPGPPAGAPWPPGPPVEAPRPPNLLFADGADPTPPKL